MKIKLLYLPRYSTSINDPQNKILSGLPFLPPLGIATLTGFLKRHHMNVTQDDLLIKVAHFNSKSLDGKINLEIFNDEKRIERFIKNGYDPELEEEGEKILSLTKIKGFDVIGFSIYDTHNPSSAGVAMVLGKLIKEKYDITIVAGGRIHEEVVKSLLTSRFIDYKLEDEVSLLDFCKAFEDDSEINKVRGIRFLSHQGNVVHSDTRNEFQIITRPIPRPSFDGLPLRLYKPRIPFEFSGEKFNYKILVLPYIFVRNCPNGCAFCSLGVLPFYSAKKPEEVINDLRYLSKKYRTKYFFFINSSINPKRIYTEMLIREFKRNDLHIFWSDSANFHEMTKQLVNKLKEIGAVKLCFGIESASRRVLRFIDKPYFTIRYAEEILRKSYEVGIYNELDIICGFPYETTQDIKITLNFIKRNMKYIQDFSLFKFWLDGKIKKYPERYGIRIRQKENERICRPSSQIAFDEITGLSWEEKVKQIEKHYGMLKMLHEEVNKNSRFPPLIKKEEAFFIHFMKVWNNPYTIPEVLKN
jgi:radical SAM superfamily enzyme YgiQ (UPF0313 family)